MDTIEVEADTETDRLIFHAPALYKDLLRQIPGMKWHRGTDTWRAPLSWATAQAARAVLGGRMELAESALAWGYWRAEYLAEARILKEATPPEGEYGYQETGVAWLGHIRCGVLGDEPGLGKTRQAILAMETPALIITTNSTKLNWVSEIARWRPNLTAATLTGSTAQKTRVLEAGGWDVAVVNWEAIRTMSRLAPYGSLALTDKEKTPGPLNRPWATLIADEVHAAKDPKSKQTRAFWAIAASAERRYGLSGTLTPESVVDLWAVMHGIYPADYPSRTAFIDRYCVAAENYWGGLEILGINPARKDELFSFFGPRFFRRTKAEVLPQLPPKVYSVRYLGMEPKQRKAYLELEEDFLTQVEGGLITTPSGITNHTRLTQSMSATPAVDGDIVTLTSPSNKVNALLELIEESPNEPLAVFSPSRKLLDLAAAALEKAKVGFSYIHGDQTAAQRQRAIDDFMCGLVPVVLATTSAGGTGINLQRASRLVFLSRPERAVESVQAEDRVHRIGQTGSVEIIDLVSWDTVEHDVHESLIKKGLDAQVIYNDPQVIKRNIETRRKGMKLPDSGSRGDGC